MAKNKSLGAIIKNGLLDENPTFRLVLGTCPTLAVTTSAINGVGMGLAATFVLVFSNLVISLLRNLIPDNVRIPSFIVVISTFVTMVEMFMHAYLPDLFEALGLFIPLIVVNCIILARAEAFASKNGPIASICDGLGMGLGFTAALTLIGSIRELIGNGSVFGFRIMTAGYEPMLLILMPAGGFLMFGLILGAINAITAKASEKKEGTD
ncbi:MAG: electron transport complex subunit E [Clostridiales bacterium]|nr:electron transport complex subunit E [Clostridiales bacterium]